MDATEHDDQAAAGYLTLGILAYVVVGLVVATARVDSAGMPGLAHFLGYLGDIIGWPLVLLGVA